MGEYDIHIVRLKSLERLVNAFHNMLSVSVTDEIWVFSDRKYLGGEHNILPINLAFQERPTECLFTLTCITLTVPSAYYSAVSKKLTPLSRHFLTIASSMSTFSGL